MRGSGRLAGGAVGVLVAIVLMALLTASPAAAETTVEVAPGYAGTYVPGRELPVRVVVSADRLVQGELVVRAEAHGMGTSTEVRQRIEVPGASAKDLLVVVPLDAGFAPFDRVSVSARLVHGDTVLAETARAAFASPSSDTELVGLLPAAAAQGPLPGPVQLPGGTGVARFAALGAGELGAAPGSFGPLSMIAAAPGDLASLSPGSLRALLVWVGGGGTLLVDAAEPASVDALPQELRPSAGRVRSGLGWVVDAGGAVQAGRWEEAVEPTTTPVLDNRGFDGGQPLGDLLASDAGLRIPRIGWLLLFLLGYAALVGPVVAIVLRRRGQSELAWVVIPLVAVLFTGGSLVGSGGTRTGTRSAHATILATAPGGSLATMYVGVAARGAQTAEIGFRPGWTARRTATGFDGVQEADTRSGQNGQRALLPLDTGEFGVVVGRGPVDLGGRLEVTGSSTAGGGVEGVVRNGLPFALQHVVVRSGGDVVPIGELQPGAEARWTSADRVEEQPGRFRSSPEEAAWHVFDQPQRSSAVSAALWEASGSPGRHPASFGQGTLLASGWTTEYRPAVDAPGGVVGGRTVVTGVGAVAAAPEAPLGDAVGELVRGTLVTDGLTVRASPTMDGGHSVIRTVVPRGAASRPLMLRAPVFGATIEVLTQQGWQEVAAGPAAVEPPPAPFGDRGFPPGLFGPVGHIALPDGAVVDGAVLVRTMEAGPLAVYRIEEAA